MEVNVEFNVDAPGVKIFNFWKIVCNWDAGMNMARKR